MTSDDRGAGASRHRRPALPGAPLFEALPGAGDPAERAAAAERAAVLLVRGARHAGDEHVADRVVRLAEDEGLETMAELWSTSPPETLAGALWRLYLLRTWVHLDPVSAAREFDRGRPHTPVHEVVAGVVDPPGPEEVRELADQVLRGVARGDFADTLWRAAAFARVVAAGRAHESGSAQPAGTTYASDLSASRLLTLAEQLEGTARLEVEGRLG